MIRRRPDVVVIVLDTVRAASGPTGPMAAITMPWLSAWASGQATIYPRAMSVAPWTLPAHGSLFTGCYPSTHGANELQHHFDPPVPTMAEWFKDAGYRTAAVSANAWVSPGIGFARGFDKFIRAWQLVQRDTDLTSAIKESGDIAPQRERIGRVMSHARPATLLNEAARRARRKLRYGDYNAPKVTRSALRMLRSAGSDPVFLFLNYMDAHGPYWGPRRFRRALLPADVPPRAARKIDQNPQRVTSGVTPLGDSDFAALRALYEAELRYLDEHVAAMVDGIAKVRDLDNTVIAIVSDHGENVGERGMLGHVYSMWETVLHVPLIIRYPGGEGGGCVDRRLAQQVDIFPTLADAMGETLPGPHVQGVGLRQHAPRDFAVAEHLGPMPTMDSLRHQCPGVDVSRFDRAMRALRTEADEKLIWDSRGAHRLYDLRTDPMEVVDSVAARPERAAELQALLASWVERVVGSDPVEARDQAVDASVRYELEALGYLG